MYIDVAGVLVLASMSIVVFQKPCTRSKVRKVAMVTGFEEQILRSIPAEDTFELQVYSNSAAVGLEVDFENLSDFDCKYQE